MNKLQNVTRDDYRQPNQMPRQMTTSKSKSQPSHMGLLRKKGYSLRTAAPLLGVHFGHLHQVLQGRRESRRLIRAVEALPTIKKGSKQ